MLFPKSVVFHNLRTRTQRVEYQTIYNEDLFY